MFYTHDSAVKASRLFISLYISVLWLSAFANPASAQTRPDPNHPGKAIYDNICATCHATPTDPRTPSFSVLTAMPADQIDLAMSEGGKMAPMAAALSRRERMQLVAYLTSGQQQSDNNWSDQLACSDDNKTVDVDAPIISVGYSVDRQQTRSLTAAQAGINKEALKNLQVAWAIAFPRQGSGTGVAIVGDTLFVTGGSKLLALDAATGCARWSIAANSRNTPTFGDIDGRKVVALSVNRGDVLVVDAKTGAKIWQASGQATGNSGSIRGGVVIYQDKIIVPISASGVAAGMRANFECCEGHGAVVALSAKDGSKMWEYQTMRAATYNGQVSSEGVKQRGPSGAPIWSYPVIDEKRNRVIVTTGENTSHPGTNTSDAVIALDLDTGKAAWLFQAIKADIWNMSCRIDKERAGPNCPWRMQGDKGVGRDFDFGAGAIVVSDVNGKDIILAGQKSGDTWALDADTGKLLWNVRFGNGTSLGGIHWGISTDGERLFAPVSDPLNSDAIEPQPGVFTVDIKTGKPAWAYHAQPNCSGKRGEWVNNCDTKYGFSAAPLTVDGAVIAATLGGEVMIFDGKTGELINQFDTVGPIDTLNDIDGHGGSIDSHSISAGAGMIFINSGYGSFQQTPGNVLIAYKPKK